MREQAAITHSERVLAGIAHGSIILAPLTSGIGGILAALVIWLIQRRKSAYVAAQALQAMVYQALTFILTMLIWACWGTMWIAIILQPLTIKAKMSEAAPPVALWIGLILLLIPVGVWGLMLFDALCGAARCLGGDDFQYAIIGNWLQSQK